MPFPDTKTCLAALLFAALTATPAPPADDAACAAEVIPAEWDAWAHPKPAAADAALDVGDAYSIALAPIEEIELQGFEGKELPEGSRGAAFSFAVAQAGTYDIGVDDPMWIDVIGANGVVESVRHGHGPACSGIRKIVGFPLEAGTYRLELSAAQVPRSLVMVLGPSD